jgi:hypothetical protein
VRERTDRCPAGEDNPTVTGINADVHHRPRREEARPGYAEQAGVKELRGRA